MGVCETKHRDKVLQADVNAGGGGGTEEFKTSAKGVREG